MQERFLTSTFGARADYVRLHGLYTGLRGSDLRLGLIDTGTRALNLGVLKLALSVIVIAAVRAPAASGVKWPWIVQFAPIARLDPQLFANTNEEAFVPVTAILLMASTELPVFVKIILCERLVVLTS